MLEAIGLYWLNQVNDELGDKGTINFELLGEAVDAIEIAHGNLCGMMQRKFKRGNIEATKKGCA